jgi:hypothetical protein
LFAGVLSLELRMGGSKKAKKRFSSLLSKVNQKRLRRMEYALETGKFPPTGWTPPDPENRSTQNISPYAPFWKH